MKCTNNWQRQTLTRFFFAAASPLQEKPSEAVSKGSGAAAPVCDKRNEQCLTREKRASAAASFSQEKPNAVPPTSTKENSSVRGSKLSKGEAERNGKRSERLRQISGGSGAAAPDYDKISSA